MCLAVPGKIVKIGSDGMAHVEVMGARATASLDLLPHARVGDFILVHAGFGIEIVSEDDAFETLALIDQLFEVTGA